MAAPILPVEAMPIRVGVAVVGTIIIFGLIMAARSLNQRVQASLTPSVAAHAVEKSTSRAVMVGEHHQAHHRAEGRPAGPCITVLR